ncbi:Hemerythrin, partial [Dissostichus eleginoides]
MMKMAAVRLAPSQGNITCFTWPPNAMAANRQREQALRCPIAVQEAPIPTPTPCPSAVRSLRHKMDELHLLIQSNKTYGDCSAICLTETWLDHSIPDQAVSLAGYTLHRADRSWSTEAIEKLRGCFACTDWEVFHAAGDLHAYTDT